MHLIMYCPSWHCFDCPTVTVAVNKPCVIFKQMKRPEVTGAVSLQLMSVIIMCCFQPDALLSFDLCQTKSAVMCKKG